MTKIKIRSLALAILFSFLIFTSPSEAARSYSHETLSPVLLFALADTAREGEQLLRIQPEEPRTSRGRVLMAAFEILGWEHELSLVESLCPDGFLACLSPFVHPGPPPSFLDDPYGLPDEKDIAAILDWIRSCRTSMSWDFSLEGNHADLRVHREGSAIAEDLWEVRIEEGLEENIAKEKLAGLSGTPFALGLRRTADGRFDLISGPWPRFAQAREAFASLPPTPGMHLAPTPSRPGEPPLFWAAIRTRDLDRLPAIRFASELGSNRSELSTIARAFGAEGGINGGYFSASGPIGTLVVDGKLLRQPYKDRSALGFSRGQPPVFGNGAMTLSLETKETVLPLDRLNEIPRDGEVSLFLPDKRFPDPPAPESGDLFAMPVVAEGAGSFSFPPVEGTLFYRGKGEDLFKAFSRGEKVEVRSRWTEPRFEGRETVVQAGPSLVGNGISSLSEEFFDETTRTQKHPRSLVGWDGNDVWWIVVDGRIPSHSLGLTLEECAELAISLGLTEALNLDGGGSSALWWHGRLVNLPSGGKERPIPYAILFGVPSEPSFSSLR